MNPPPGHGEDVGIDIDGSGIDMYPAPAARMMSEIETVSSDARTEWNSFNPRILDLESRLGNGPLGRPVAAQYNPTAAQIRTYIHTMLNRLNKVSEAGTKAPPLYTDTDMRAGQEFEF
ncbi:hypothetical protein [Actinophytocola oryzae]|uniref:PE family protein n=1 Tax=Actinophytocola oryzae TaxID=502181 RepID=A0A4R7UTS2_9PSEU|nr:hypothetical protein [Actinophytocola oryzae]TDV40068.1 hypothetical protein CLV71_12485 [Actinophytocola oryzae]